MHRRWFKSCQGLSGDCLFDMGDNCALMEKTQMSAAGVDLRTTSPRTLPHLQCRDKVHSNDQGGEQNHHASTLDCGSEGSSSRGGNVLQLW